MKQVLQDLQSGRTYLEQVPTPQPLANSNLIRTRVSLISTGTERMLVSFGKSGLVAKARQQPEKVRQVFDKIGTDGLLTTIDAIRSKLGQPIPLGYCNVGIVLESGDRRLSPGDRVVSNGAHADVVRVPKHLCARIPDSVRDDHAAFTIVASIGLQGIRLAQPTLGEVFVVTGVGLIGLLTVQLLRCHGCRVLAIDFDSTKLELARKFGAVTCNPGAGEDPVMAGLAISRGLGVDGVIITASTKSSDPVSEAARMCRKRGRIVLVGVTGLELNRADFYEKELSFQVSCSYGPGRYDPAYEEGGHDYPVGYVRWTEQRNFEAVLDMMAAGQLDVEPLISHRFAFEDAASAYELLSSDQSTLGILLQYESAQQQRDLTRVLLSVSPEVRAAKPVLGFIGAGNYASRVLIPAFKAADAQLHTVVTSGGLNGVIHGRKAGFQYACTDVDEMLADPEINAVVVATQHHTHARFVEGALRAGKHVFVEKPLAMDQEGLTRVREAYQACLDAGSPQTLMVGFNRRFSPLIRKMRELLSPLSEPKAFILTMNAGSIPANHWTQDPEKGGGRIIGEACHYIDLMRFLAGSKIVSVQARGMGVDGRGGCAEDRASITLGFADGSLGSIHYLANGAATFPKERVEIFCAGTILQLDNFRVLRGFGVKGFRRLGLWRQDKGQKACVDAFLSALESGQAPPIPIDEIFEVAEITLSVASQLRAQ